MKKIIFTLLLCLMVSISYATDPLYPSRGSSMEDVQKITGEPENKMDAVGEPPITRWVYSDFTVYFEHQKVIHTVKNNNR